MSDKYILNAAGEPEPADLMTWAEWFETSGDARRVARDTIGDVTISTVFLGLNHNFGEGPPILFETMIFDGGDDERQWRYSTRDEALAGHAAAVRLVSEQETSTP